MKNIILLVSCAAMIWSPFSNACSAFRISSKTESYMGKSYDWFLSHGHLLVNKRNVEKESLILDPEAKGVVPAKWTSRYGSVTFTQYGREFPLGGINEQGLAIEILWLTTSIYEDPDDRPVLNELQWIQYHLDQYSTVAEVVENAPKVRLQPVTADIHYFVCDASGDCATVEFIRGEITIHTGDSMPVQAITNSTYSDSWRYARAFKPFGGDLDVNFEGYNSLDRFVRAASVPLSSRVGESSTDLGFRTLETVRGRNSQWNIVYNLKKKIVTFRVLGLGEGEGEGRRVLDLARIDFSCRSKVRYFDLETRGDGAVYDRLRDFSEVENRRMVLRSIGEDMPPEIVDAIANYSESTTCRE